MEGIKVCRICLVMEVKMFDLRVFPLDTYFEPLIGYNPLCNMDIPPFACYECASLIKKYYLFRERCTSGQYVLYGILNSKGKITPQDIKKIDRDQFNLSTFLRTTRIPEDDIIHYTYDEQEIKHEPSDYLPSPGSIKQEDDDVADFGLSSDDDEPLSLHKSNKEKGKKRSKKEKKEDVKVTEEFQLEESVANFDGLQLEMLPERKKKRGRPRKTEIPDDKTDVKVKKPRRTRNTGGVSDDDMDLEEFVTIMKLTLEEQMEEIEKRKTSSNYLNSRFQCNLCYKGFIDTHAWKHHVGKHDISAGDIECSVCKFRFKTRRTLLKHASNHEKKYACKSCAYVSKTTTQAKQHQRWHKGVTYKCQHCDEVSTKWTSYLSHVRIKHPSEFICGVCGYSFVSKLGLTMHRTMMHKTQDEEADNKEGPYCAECDVKFISEEAYKRHMVTSVKHTQSKDFSKGCRVCGETFVNSEELRIHHRKEHARQRPKNYGKKPSKMAWPSRCEHCNEEIASARDYWTHFRRAHPDKNYPIQKNYVCDICGKSFRGNAFLVYHKRTHSAERAYKCAQCPKAFYNRTNLQMHEKTHSDSRPYPCDVCFKAFKCKGALDRHYRSHTGVKPYECEVCGKAFGQSNSRKLHVRTVHLKQPAPYVSRSRLERRRQNGQREQLGPFLY